MRRMFSLAALSPGLLLLAACGKTSLSVEQTFDLPLEGKSFEIDAIKSEQKIRVSATATGAPISVYIYLERDSDKAIAEIMRGGKYSPVVLASKEKTEQVDNLEAVIPANNVAVVHLMRSVGKAANVKLKITN